MDIIILMSAIVIFSIIMVVIFLKVKKHVQETINVIDEESLKIVKNQEKLIEKKIKLEETRINNMASLLKLRENALSDRVFTFYNDGEERYNELVHLQDLQSIYINQENFEKAKIVQKEINAFIRTVDSKK